MSMTLAAIQKEIDDWVKQYAEGYWSIQENITCLMEEVGELARDVNVEHGPKNLKDGDKKTNITAEIGDILYVLGVISNIMDISLDDAWKSMQYKLHVRDKDRWKKAA